MDIEIIEGFYHVHLPGLLLRLTKDEFTRAQHRGKGWKRRQASAPRHATMHEHAEDARIRLASGL